MTQEYVIPPAPVAALPVSGSAALFPVRRILCIARNYAAHAREMGADPRVEPPFFFAKPLSALRAADADGAVVFPYPAHSREVHHEVELVVALGSGGRELSAAAAARCVWGYGVGLDMTCRDLQAQAKQKGRPWEAAKGFDASAPVSALRPADGVVLRGGEVRLEVNGELRQRGDLADMILDIPELIAYFSRQLELLPGDLIFTGTPEGVGPVLPGDVLCGRVEGVGELRVQVLPAV